MHKITPENLLLTNCYDLYRRLPDFTPLEKAPDSRRGYKSEVSAGGLMPPAFPAKRPVSLTGFTIAHRILCKNLPTDFVRFGYNPGRHAQIHFSAIPYLEGSLRTFFIPARKTSKSLGF